MTAATLPDSIVSENTKLQPFQIGKHFVRQYYTYLSREPSRIHCFYSESSCLQMGDENDSSSSESNGIDEISKKFAEQQSTESLNVCVSSLDVQSAPGNALFIMVVGDMIFNSGNVKRFVQSFFLVEQQQSFFIRNSAFRYLKDPEFSEEFEVEEAQEVPSSIETPVSPVEEAAVAVKKPESPVKSVEKKESISVAIEVPEKEVAVPEKDAEVPRGPQSWARLAANQREKWGPASPKVTATSIPMKEGSQVEKQPKKEKTESKTKPINVAASVYVRNLPENITLQEIKQALGKVKYVDFNSNKSAAVVEYFTAEEGKAALGREFIIRSHKLLVEERRPRPVAPLSSAPAGPKSTQSSQTKKKPSGNKQPKNSFKANNVSTLE